MKLYYRLLNFVYPHSGKLIFAIVAGILTTFFFNIQILSVKLLIDNVFMSESNQISNFVIWMFFYKIFGINISQHENHAMDMLFIMMFLIPIIFFGKGLFHFFYVYYIRWVGQSVILDLRKKYFWHISHLSMRFFRTRSTGDLISRLTNDINRIENGVSFILGDFVKQLLTVISLSLIVILMSWKLTLISLVVLPVSLLFIVHFAQKLRRVSTHTQERMADINNTALEAFTGIHVVKAFGMERFEAQKFNHYAKKYFQEMMRAAKYMALSNPIMELIAALGGCVVLFYGGYLVLISKEMTVGSFMTFLIGLFSLYAPIKNLTKLNLTLQHSLAAARRVFEILDEQPDIRDPETPVYLKKFHNQIQFEKVNFSYEDKPILKDLDLQVPKGIRLAVVGYSGSGKTTLVNLIPRFYDVTGGRITIDGHNIKDLNLSSLRSKIGIVTQDIILFNDTISRNIAYGLNGFSEIKIQEAAVAAYADEFIRNLPEAYETIIGEKGIKLSGGQRQRIAIARAILKNPPILILDEATSSLDSESEAMVQKALNKLMENRTTFVVAHRLATIKNADKIVVMENGKITDMGIHEDLLQRNATYRKLHEMQFGMED